jgi:hypothetical protein
MEKSLTDILRDALIGKKIKLYKVLDKNNSVKGMEYFITQKDFLIRPKKCEITGESYGFVKSIETENDQYEGDYYNVVIVDDNDKPIHFNGLNSITSNLEIIE